MVLQVLYDFFEFPLVIGGGSGMVRYCRRGLDLTLMGFDGTGVPHDKHFKFRTKSCI